MRYRVAERKELRDILQLQYTVGTDRMLINLRNWAIRVATNHRLTEESLKRLYKRFVDKYYNCSITYNMVDIIRGMEVRNCTEPQFLSLIIYGLNESPSTGMGVCYYVLPPQETVPVILRTRITVTPDESIALEFLLERQKNVTYA